MDCSLPGSSVHGILQARILGWVAIPFTRVSSQPRDWTRVCCIAGKFLTVWATREAHSMCVCLCVCVCIKKSIMHKRLQLRGELLRGPASPRHPPSVWLRMQSHCLFGYIWEWPSHCGLAHRASTQAGCVLVFLKAHIEVNKNMPLCLKCLLNVMPWQVLLHDVLLPNCQVQRYLSSPLGSWLVN